MMEDIALGLIAPVGKALTSANSDETTLLGAGRPPTTDDSTAETAGIVAEGRGIIALTLLNTDESIPVGINCVGMTVTADV